MNGIDPVIPKNPLEPPTRARAGDREPALKPGVTVERMRRMPIREALLVVDEEDLDSPPLEPCRHLTRVGAKAITDGCRLVSQPRDAYVA